MQLRTGACLVACLAVLVVVVMAADPPTADVMHAKCYRNKESWIAEGEVVDEDAMQVQ
jgi:hypothetical protein